MSKNKPKETIEYVIRLQDKERMLLESYATAYTVGKVGVLLNGLGIPELTKQMKDPTEMIGIFYSIAMILEFVGIETGLPTPFDFDEYMKEYQTRRAARRAQYPDEPEAGTLAMIVKDLLVKILGSSELGKTPFNVPGGGGGGF